MSSYHRKSSLYSDDSDDQTTSQWCQQNWYRLLIVSILILLSVASSTTLVYILYKDALKEKALAEKKKGWIGKWNMISPFIKHFPLGFLLGFIRNLIVLAIERQT